MNTRKKTKHNRIELSLSAMMFFSPLIQNTINKDVKISKQDKKFIKGYIKLGYFNIVLLIIIIAMQIWFYLAQNTILKQIGFFFSIILGTSLVLGTIFILKDKEILKSNSKEELTFEINSITYYIPIYNIYTWYKKHNFDNPNPILKESIILWIVFILLLLIFKNISIIVAIFAIIIMRIFFLAQGGSNSIYKTINKLFKKNPEEIWAYPKGLFMSLINKKEISENIKTSKLKFELIHKISNKDIVFQHIVLHIILIFLIYKGVLANNINLVIGSLLISARYIVMYIVRKHTPNIPIIKEITNLFFKNKNEI